MTVDVTDAAIGSAAVELTPLEGTLEAIVTLSDLEIDLAAELRASVFGQCLTEQSTDMVVVDQADHHVSAIHMICIGVEVDHDLVVVGLCLVPCHLEINSR